MAQDSRGCFNQTQFAARLADYVVAVHPSVMMMSPSPVARDPNVTSRSDVVVRTVRIIRLVTR
jgi:hypothetical protein